LINIIRCNVTCTTNAHLFCFEIPFSIFLGFVFVAFEALVIQCGVGLDPFQHLFFLLVFQKDLYEFLLLTGLLCGRCLLLSVLVLIRCVTALDISRDKKCFPLVWCLWSLLGPSTTCFFCIFPEFPREYCTPTVEILLLEVQLLQRLDGRADVMVDVIIDGIVVTRSLAGRE